MIEGERCDITQTTYPEVDMQNLPFEDEIFDVVISDQVIEHLENPQKAVDESFRVLKKGGIAIHTSCLINYIHEPAPDYWRFTPEALKYLLRNFSEIIECGSWGNRIAIILIFMFNKFRYLNIRPKGVSIFKPLASLNERKYPITTWIVAKK
jgi:ubiquinone/menaquinone biosynthesis C-methylase UbiE